MTHSGKHRGRQPLFVSLPDFKTSRWETSQLLRESLVDDEGEPGRWKRRVYFEAMQRWHADKIACPLLPGLPPVFFKHDRNGFSGDFIQLNFTSLNNIAKT